MAPIELFINPETRLLRSGWRALAFVLLLVLPRIVLLPLIVRSEGARDNVFEVSSGMILTYVLLIGWTLLVSWVCLRMLDRLPLGSLGFAFYPGWWRDILRGCAWAASMIALIVALQWIAGGTGIQLNPVWWRNGSIDDQGLSLMAGDVLAALLLLILSGAFEELLYRGYAFQTLLRGLPAFFPVLLLALLFGYGHWNNPNRTFFSTANTVLAGIWLAIAYIKTRNLWFPTALHFTWNWVMGAVFGVPVSGLLIPRHPFLLSNSGEPLWLTGGAYGLEGGAAATIMIALSTLAIWRSGAKNPVQLHADDKESIPRQAGHF